MVPEEKREYKTVAHLLSALCLMCAANPEKVVDLLSNYLWVDEEIVEIKQALKDQGEEEWFDHMLKQFHNKDKK